MHYSVVCLSQHEFVQRLSAVLVTVGASPVARMAAGLQLKNQLTSKDPDMKFQYQQRWLTIPVETREYIKKNVRRPLSHIISIPIYLILHRGDIPSTEIIDVFQVDMKQIYLIIFIFYSYSQLYLYIIFL